MAMPCPHHSRTGSGAHGSRGTNSPKLSTTTKNSVTTTVTTTTCDNCGSTKSNTKTVEISGAQGNGKPSTNNK